MKSSNWFIAMAFRLSQTQLVYFKNSILTNHGHIINFTVEPPLGIFFFFLGGKKSIVGYGWWMALRRLLFIVLYYN